MRCLEHREKELRPGLDVVNSWGAHGVHFIGPEAGRRWRDGALRRGARGRDGCGEGRGRW
jgi:hypothetical protein